MGRLEGSHGWKEGTGNGQGQRIIDNTPDSACPAASTHNTAPVGRRAHRLSASPSPTATELEDREEEKVDVEARLPTQALNASASGELNTLFISDRLPSALLR